MTLIKIILLLGISSIVFAQEGINGFFMSTYSQKISRIENENPDSTDLSNYPKIVNRDTSFNQHYFIIDFKPKNRIELKSITKEPIKGKYKIKKDKIKINSGKFKWQGVIQSEDILKFEIDRNKNYYEELYFKRINKTKSENLNSCNLINTYWRCEIDSNSSIFNSKIFFLDSNYLIITNINDNWGYTDWGEYNIEQFKDYISFAYFDNFRTDENVFHLKLITKDTIEAEFTEYDFFHRTNNEKPQYRNLRFIKDSLISEKNKNLLTEQIIGKWIAKDYKNIINSTLYDSIISADYILELKSDGEFQIEITGEVIINNKKELKSQSESGTWELGQTGEYISLSTEEDMEYLTVKSIEKEYLEFFMLIHNLEINSRTGTKVKFEKPHCP
jgi:hypothetical protein